MSSRYEVGVTYVLLLSRKKNSSESSCVDMWKVIHIFIATSRSRSVSFVSDKNFVDTASKASSGQGCNYIYFQPVTSLKNKLTWNQSIVQQLTIAGNLRRRFLKPSPIGLIAKTTCNCSRVIWTNRLKSATALPSVWTDLSLCLSICRILSHISIFSSRLKILGTSPTFNKLLRSSRKDSSFICGQKKINNHRFIKILVILLWLENRWIKMWREVQTQMLFWIFLWDLRATRTIHTYEWFQLGIDRTRKCEMRVSLMIADPNRRLRPEARGFVVVLWFDRFLTGVLSQICKRHHVIYITVEHRRKNRTWKVLNSSVF